jgi:U-box domain-containing protein 5
MFDLCTTKCGMSVCSDGLPSDLYPPTNLLYREGNLKGFRTEPYIRPPVSLYFHLPFPVVLVKISMDTTIDKQSSTKYSIGGSSVAGKPCSKICSRLKSTQPSASELEYTRMGIGEAVSGRIEFSNMTETGYTTSSYPLKSGPKTSLLNHIAVLQITILHTKDASIPCLKNLSIIVKPRPMRHDERRRLEQAFKPQVESSTSFSFFGGSDSTPEELTTSNCSQTTSNFSAPDRTTAEEKIPAEFLDEITTELMLIPMILPSGKVVDRSTLEKCNESQAMYGGLPRDPFSGRVYTENLKPVFSAELKSRIDNYLANHGTGALGDAAFSARPRTLGDAASIQRFINGQNRGQKRKHL